MTPEKILQLQQHAQAIAALLYEETDSEQLNTLENIEVTVRDQILQYVSPEVALFLSKAVPKAIKVDGDGSIASSENWV